MASFVNQQSRSFEFGISHPSKPSPSIPVRVSKSINSKVFAELLTGTVAIFIVGVLFWKLGKFIRRFNRNKVLRAGKSVDARYARTWYGWIAQPTHERNKKAFADFFTRMRDSVAWKSARDDYSWVWWDPGDIERQKRQREKRRLWWLPKCFKSYEDFPTADEIWNPCARPQCHGALREGRSTLPVSLQVGEMPQLKDNPLNSSPQPQPLMTMIDSHQVTNHSMWTELFPHPMQARHNDSNGQPRVNSLPTTSPSTRDLSTHLNIQSLPCRQSQPYHTRGSTTWPRGGVTREIPSQLDSAVQPMTYHHATIGPNPSPDKVYTTQPVRNSHRHKHCRWSARMQLGSRRTGLSYGGDSSGPPGTPLTELLTSCFSDHSSLFRGSLKQKSDGKRRYLRSSEEKASSTCSGRTQLPFTNNTGGNSRIFHWNSAPASYPQDNRRTPTSRPTLYNEWRSICGQNHSSLLRHKGKFPEKRSSITSTDQIQLKTGGAVENMSDWEVRMLERLDRKLLWVFNEFTPGQKPYHFAILANHWLNIETWIVYDPISRVPTDARRERGDPRFNVPYPEPCLIPKPKYPVSTQKRANIPRIKSWRAAVNEQRHLAGIREALRTITLYEESAAEPPDGHIDPGCWALPKPPQGFQMSTAQQNAWYEGGAGWQETLDDWQQVRRGYRLHKALHEGRVNRGRVKDMATQISRTCRPVAGKLIPSFDVSKTRISTPLVS